MPHRHPYAQNHQSALSDYPLMNDLSLCLLPLCLLSMTQIGTMAQIATMAQVGQVAIVQTWKTTTWIKTNATWAKAYPLYPTAYLPASCQLFGYRLKPYPPKHACYDQDWYRQNFFGEPLSIKPPLKSQILQQLLGSTMNRTKATNNNQQPAQPAQQKKRQPPKRKMLIVLMMLTFGFITPTAQANLLDTVINRIGPIYRQLVGTVQDNPAQSSSDSLSSEPSNQSDTTAIPPTAVPIVLRHDIITADSPPIAHNNPDLATLLQAEFALDRNQPYHALDLYKSQAFKDNATAVFERALTLSMQLESPNQSLQFAKAWQDSHSDHIPVWFYVTHLALKAENYPLAAQNIRLILQYDPKADLSQIFTGILPKASTAQRQLLHELQSIDGDNNPSLSVLKAGLLMQLNEPTAAILYLNNALKDDGDNLAYLTLKADILKQMGDKNALLKFLANAIKNSHGKTQTQIQLYTVRYLIDLGELTPAWRVLQAIDPKDDELTLLASLVALDLQHYADAETLLHDLSHYPNRTGEAYYYLGISFERRHNYEQALHYFAQVDDVQFVLDATKKQVGYELLFDRPKNAINALINLRKRYDIFASDSYLLQADILARTGNRDDAKTLLDNAYTLYPDEPNLLYAKVKLMDDTSDYDEKLADVDTLLTLDPDNDNYRLLKAKLQLERSPDDQDSWQLLSELSQSSDSNTALQALLALAHHAQKQGDYQAVLNYLQTPYELTPSLATGTALLKAYQGLGDNGNVKRLLNELTARFGKTP